MKQCNGLRRLTESRGLLLAATAICAMPAHVLADPAPAQTPGAAPPAVEDVTVTAQKRKQKIQDVPISITVLDSKALRRLNVQTTDELAQYVPSVEIAMPSGKGNQPLISIRGIGLNDTNTNNAGPNGVYVDEVYQATPAGQTFQTFDLSRIEVLKGPQGTLYGRNTTGGAIDYVTAKPTDQFYASEDLQYGSWNTVSTESVVNGPLIQGVNGRAAIQYDYSDGYFKDLTDHNTTNGANDLAYRGELAVDRIENLDLLFNFHGGYVDRRPDEYRSIGALTGPFSTQLCSNPMVLANECTDLFGYKSPKGFYSGFYNRDQPLRIAAFGGSVRADYHWDGITLTSLTAIEVSHKNHEEDSDAAPNQLLEINYGVRSNDITQEFRVAGGGSDYHWLVGLYGLDEHLNQDQPITLLNGIDQIFGVPGAGAGASERARTVNGQFTQSAAVFGQGDYEIFPNARITLGGRLTYEHKDFNGLSLASFEDANGNYPQETPLYSISENLADRAASWHAGFDYKFTPDILAYVTASTGFKSGGFNGGFLANDVPEALDQLKPIKPEYITATEAGVKTDFFNQRLRFNAAIFDYTYHDLQIYNIITSPLSATNPEALPISVLTNAPKAFIRGAEFEFDATPIEHLTTTVNLSFLDAKLGNFVSGAGTGAAQNFTGNQLPNAPKFNAVLGADYALPLARGDVVEFSVSGTYRSHQFFESSNNPIVAQNGYWLLDARLSWTSPNKRWDVAVLGKNLSGQEYLNFSNDLSAGGLGFYEEIVGPPRYVGGEVIYRY